MWFSRPTKLKISYVWVCRRFLSIPLWPSHFESQIKESLTCFSRGCLLKEVSKKHVRSKNGKLLPWKSCCHTYVVVSLQPHQSNWYRASVKKKERNIAKEPGHFCKQTKTWDRGKKKLSRETKFTFVTFVYYMMASWHCCGQSRFVCLFYFLKPTFFLKYNKWPLK